MHTHEFSFLGFLQQTEFEAGRPLYQCLQCGTSALRSGSEKYFAIVPSWASDRLDEIGEDRRVRVVEKRPQWQTPIPRKPRQKKPRKALGRGLRDLRQQGKVTFDDLRRMFDKTSK